MGHLNKASVIPRPFGPPEVTGCGQLRWLSAGMIHEQGTLLSILDLLLMKASGMKVICYQKGAWW